MLLSGYKMFYSHISGRLWECAGNWDVIGDSKVLDIDGSGNGIGDCDRLVHEKVDIGAVDVGQKIMTALNMLMPKSNSKTSMPLKVISRSKSTDTKLSHVKEDGKASMVNVGGKDPTCRIAVASCRVFVGKEVFNAIKENNMKKGDVLTVSKVAGIMAAKRTSELIPLCHNIPLSVVEVTLTLNAALHSDDIVSNVECFGKTGVEMEALTTVSVTALTLYDMCKALTHNIRICEIKLEKKHGGKDYYNSGK